MKIWSPMAFCLLLLAGCAMVVRTEVTRFNRMPPPGPKTTFAVLPLANQGGDLEFDTYSGLVRDHLIKLGYVPVDNLAQARLWVSLAYSINGHIVQSEEPVFGQTGGGITLVSGSIGGEPFSGIASEQPTYGVVGSETVTRTVFSRAASLIIVDAKRSTKDRLEQVFRATAVSAGSSGSLPTVMPYIIDGIFSGFPGKNGESIRINEKITR